MKTKQLIRKTLPILIFLSLCTGRVFSQDCGCTHTIEPVNLTDGTELGFAPGDVICIKGGEYGSLHWKNINGTAENPIIIKNCDGQVAMSGNTYGWKWHNSKHFKILGNGDANYEYGFKVTTTSSFFMPMEYFTTNFEIAYVEVVGLEEEGHIYSGFAGIGLKTSPYQDCNLFQTKDAWAMEDVTIHNCYIHEVGGEGIYAGHGFHQGREESRCPDGVFTYPHAIHNLHIYDNIIENIGFDGIQIKNATQNTLVHDNIIKNYGLREEGAHNEGLFIGESTEGSFYNNRIENGTGHGMQINAYGNSKFYNNLVIDCGADGIYLNNQSAAFENKDGDFEFYHNTFVNMGTDAMEIYTPQDIYLTNNIFVNYGEELHDGKTPIVNGDITTNNISTIGFVDPVAGNYKLKETSMAVNAGASTIGLGFDIENNSRDMTPDVGAYEYTTTITVPTPTVNLALGKTANQSSTTNDGVASRAVDGNTNGNWTQGSITHTNEGVGESWEVDLCGYYPIGDIVIYNRTNCCSFRLDDITVSVEDLSGNIVWSENIISSSATSLTVNAGNVIGRVIRVTQNQDQPLSLAEVEVYEGVDSTVFPDLSKTYYIDNPFHNLRLAATGSSETPYTTSTTTTGEDVEWKFVDNGNGYFHIQRAAGGSVPRLQTDNTLFADMQATSSSGTFTYFDISQSCAEDKTYYLTLPDGPTDYKRLQINSSGDVLMESDAYNGVSESFRITDINSNDILTNAHEGFSVSEEDLMIIHPNPVSNTATIKGVTNSTVNIKDVNGKVVFSIVMESETESIELSNLSKGLYIVEIISFDNNQRRVIKMLKI